MGANFSFSSPSLPSIQQNAIQLPS